MRHRTSTLTRACQSARLRARSEKNADIRDDVSDDSEESEIEEELGFFSLIDAINPYTTFKHALTSAFLIFVSAAVLTCALGIALQTKNADLYRAATTVLSVEQQTVLMEVMSLAESQHPTQTL